MFMLWCVRDVMRFIYWSSRFYQQEQRGAKLSRWNRSVNYLACNEQYISWFHIQAMIVDLSHVHSIFKSIGLITCHIITLSISSTLYLWAHTLMRIASIGWYNRVMCEHTHNHNNIMHTCATKLQTIIVYLALGLSNQMFMHTHVQHAHLSGRMAWHGKNRENMCWESIDDVCMRKL